MTTTKPKVAKPTRINLKVSAKAYRVLSKMAKKEGRTILSMLNIILGA